MSLLSARTATLICMSCYASCLIGRIADVAHSPVEPVSEKRKQEQCFASTSARSAINELSFAFSEIYLSERQEKKARNAAFVEINSTDSGIRKYVL